MIIIIPTRLSGPNEFILNAANSHHLEFGLKTVLIALSDNRLRPWRASKDLMVVPAGAAYALAAAACVNTARTMRGLFGVGIPTLGFGGSSNLAQLLALVCQLDSWVKLDDDCLIEGYARINLQDGSVGVGAFTEGVPHPKELLISAHPEVSACVRLDSSERPLPVKTLKNGALIMTRGAAAAAPYPVLYSNQFGVSLRGEAYDWANRLMAMGGSLCPAPELRVKHFRQHWNKDEWITQLLLKTDIVFTDVAHYGDRREPLTDALRVNHLKRALSACEKLDRGEFRLLGDDRRLFDETLMLSAKDRFGRDAREQEWRDIASRLDAIRLAWFAAVPCLEESVLSWI